jgi:phosphate transport system substrate-binding protein
VAAVLLSACGGDGPSGVAVSGSSTVEPIIARYNELFGAGDSDVAVRLDGAGTKNGFEAFCAGEADIADASRAISAEERERCSDQGIDYVELPVALDGVTVITNASNEAIECMSFEQLYGVIGPESEGFDDWSDANGLVTEIGGEGTLPTVPLAITAPGDESGTYDSFIELALSQIAERRFAEGKIAANRREITRSDYAVQANDVAIIRGVAGVDHSLGWVGFGVAMRNREAVRMLAVDDGDGCVAPTSKTIADGSYPLSRTLYLYVNTDAVVDNADLRSFVDFYLTDAGYQAVLEANYVPLTPEQWQETVIAWHEARG